MKLIRKRIIETGFGRSIIIDEGSSAAALEVMTRFGVHPKWLIHLPPTMSPCATSSRDGLLEHPDEAFAYYLDEGIDEVVVEEKHMGSRALIAICRDPDAARRRFGVTSGETGMVYTRTGRPFWRWRTLDREADATGDVAEPGQVTVLVCMNGQRQSALCSVEKDAHYATGPLSNLPGPVH